MGILNTKTKNFRTQLLIRDDGKLEFNRLELVDRFMVVRNEAGEVVKGWLHSYNNQIPFPGYFRIQPDMVTVCYERNYLLDPYGLVPQDEKSTGVKDLKVTPGKKPINVETHDPWLVSVGKNSRLKILQKRGQGSNYDKVITFLGWMLFAEIFAMLVIYGLNRVI